MKRATAYRRRAGSLFALVINQRAPGNLNDIAGVLALAFDEPEHPEPGASSSIVSKGR